MLVVPARRFLGLGGIVAVTGTVCGRFGGVEGSSVFGAGADHESGGDGGVVFCMRLLASGNDERAAVVVVGLLVVRRKM